MLGCGQQTEGGARQREAERVGVDVGVERPGLLQLSDPLDYGKVTGAVPAVRHLRGIRAENATLVEESGGHQGFIEKDADSKPDRPR